MTRKKVPQNAPCPCGSGEKYKCCCLRTGLQWKVNENGEVFRVLPLSGDTREVFLNQREAFVRKHGKAPGPKDLVFEDSPHGEYMEHVMVETMKKVGIRPELVYAYEKTGRIVTEENQRFLTDAELAEWQAALEEYRRRHERQ